ncbi:TPA: recombinase [candidate division WOR-3 bacterium]|jgi:hypothetical protein|uniref:Epoxyqueuosine reductase QueH n=1 Tax=candidate division WOR-3 bacterium TaxID=2052148 RepID=A0A350H840_UNCW3|nr:recombinase [candidate division WOR-3 bacterium]
MEQLLLHICCGPDLTYAYEYFNRDYEVTGCFVNDNMDTLEEFEKRYLQAEIVSDHYGFKLVKMDYNNERFLSKITGLENEREQGRRCEICHKLNFERLIEKAIKMNIKKVSTTLTISPHKNVEMINRAGREVTEGSGVEFVEETLRKNNGFLRSIEMTKKLNLYRQNWCGCKFSRGSIG